MIARRLAVSCAANSLAATLIAFASYALATDVSFVGNVSYATAGNVAVLSADQVQNTDAYGMSGTLHMELWALSAPYGGSAITGYKLAQYSLGSLMAGRALANIVSPNVSLVLPPAGTWFVAVVLTEYTGGPRNNGYSTRDFVNFPAQLVTGAPPGTTPVVEYYYPPWNVYFLTAKPDEIAVLDAGAFPGWVRTGYQFYAYDPITAPPTAGTSVCRFFNVSFAPKSAHFYALHGLGCEDTLTYFPDWQLESSDAFRMLFPDINGNCASGSIPVFRFYNNGMGGAPNHRFTADATVRADMTSAGWTPEGYGPGVAFCSPQ